LKLLKFLKNLFTKQKEVPFNINHPDVANNIEFAFKCGGRSYYRFKSDYLMPVGRYKMVDAYLHEAELRMNLKTLNNYLDEIEKSLNGSKGVVNIGKAFQLLHNMRTRTKDLGFEPQTIKRLASVVYFDDTEDLREYNREHCEAKIKFWEKHDCYDFFLTRPIDELLNVKGISEESLRKYIQEAEAIIKDLTSELGMLSSTSS
jgi:hypothetical protein